VQDRSMLMPHLSELSDDGMDDDGSSGEEEGGAPAQSGLSKAEQDERMRNLVPALPDREWGRKPGDESAATKIDKRTGPSRPKITKPASADSVAMSMRPPIFAKQSFDGVVSDSDEDSEDEILPPPGTLGRKIAEMKWLERAPKIEEIDDTPDQKPKFGLGDDIDEQMRRRVWGEDDEREKDGMMDIDPDMGEEEEEFLKFSRDALGISDDVWEGILSSRLERGGESSSHRHSMTTLADSRSSFRTKAGSKVARGRQGRDCPHQIH